MAGRDAVASAAEVVEDAARSVVDNPWFEDREVARSGKSFAQEEAQAWWYDVPWYDMPRRCEELDEVWTGDITRIMEQRCREALVTPGQYDGVTDVRKNRATTFVLAEKAQRDMGRDYGIAFDPFKDNGYWNVWTNAGNAKAAHSIMQERDYLDVMAAQVRAIDRLAQMSPDVRTELMSGVNDTDVTREFYEENANAIKTWDPVRHSRLRDQLRDHIDWFMGRPGYYDAAYSPFTEKASMVADRRDVRTPGATVEELREMAGARSDRQRDLIDSRVEEVSFERMPFAHTHYDPSPLVNGLVDSDDGVPSTESASTRAAAAESDETLEAIHAVPWHLMRDEAESMGVAWDQTLEQDMRARAQAELAAAARTGDGDELRRARAVAFAKADIMREAHPECKPFADNALYYVWTDAINTLRAEADLHDGGRRKLDYVDELAAGVRMLDVLGTMRPEQRASMALRDNESFCAHVLSQNSAEIRAQADSRPRIMDRIAARLEDAWNRIRGRDTSHDRSRDTSHDRGRGEWLEALVDRAVTRVDERANLGPTYAP